MREEREKENQSKELLHKMKQASEILGVKNVQKMTFFLSLHGPEKGLGGDFLPKLLMSVLSMQNYIIILHFQP